MNKFEKLNHQVTFHVKKMKTFFILANKKMLHFAKIYVFTQNYTCNVQQEPQLYKYEVF